MKPEDEIASADVIIARFADKSPDCVVYGEELLASGKARQVIVVKIGSRDSKMVIQKTRGDVGNVTHLRIRTENQMEVLRAMVKVIHGHNDLEEEDGA